MGWPIRNGPVNIILCSHLSIDEKSYIINIGKASRPRQFTVGIKRTDSANFVLLIKLFELGMPSKDRQAFSKSNLVLEPHLFNGLGAYSTLNSIKIFTTFFYKNFTLAYSTSTNSCSSPPPASNSAMDPARFSLKCE